MKITTKQRGFCTVEIHTDKTIVYFTGNMGNNLDSVKNEVDALLGAGKWDLLRRNILNEEGSPDYSYALTSSTRIHLPSTEPHP